jgi:hypothetical protein
LSVGDINIRSAQHAIGPALGGILAVLTAALDMKATISGKQHSLLYFLAAAMQPRMLLTIDEQGIADFFCQCCVCNQCRRCLRWQWQWQPVI